MPVLLACAAKPRTSRRCAEITDPEAARAVVRYGELTARIEPLADEKDVLAPLIRGLRGTAGDWRVSTGRPGDDKDVPDMDAILADYAGRGARGPDDHEARQRAAAHRHADQAEGRGGVTTPSP